MSREHVSAQISFAAVFATPRRTPSGPMFVRRLEQRPGCPYVQYNPCCVDAMMRCGATAYLGMLMPWNRVLEFTDPFLCQRAIQGADVELFPTAKGHFHTRLVQVGLNTVWMQRFDIALPQISAASVMSGRKAVGFLTDVITPDFKHCGSQVVPGEIILFDSEIAHHRSTTAVRFGSMSLPVEDFSTRCQAIVGHERVKGLTKSAVRPAPALMSRLLMLHRTIGQIAQELPDVITRPEVHRALEEQLIHILVRCLTDDFSTKTSRHGGRHSVIIRQFEQFLRANPDRPLYLSEICAATGARERTLRAACEEYLGMGPIRYLTLRRMHLARRALLCTEPSKASVTRVVTDHGFWELGRFSIAYRSLFGESPSETLRRPPQSRPADLVDFHALRRERCPVGSISKPAVVEHS